MKITAARADELLAHPWFGGYTSDVDMYEDLVTVDEFDAAARAAQRGDTEYALFGGGLTVRGTVDLGRDVHSIYAVRGVLRARRIILGDAVLIVESTADIGEWLFGGRNEGLFDIGGQQIESDHTLMLAGVQAPVIAMFDRSLNEFVLREHGEPRETGQLVAQVLDEGDVDPGRLRERLIAGQPVFR